MKWWCCRMPHLKHERGGRMSAWTVGLPLYNLRTFCRIAWLNGITHCLWPRFLVLSLFFHSVTTTSVSLFLPSKWGMLPPLGHCLCWFCCQECFSYWDFHGHCHSLELHSNDTFLFRLFLATLFTIGVSSHSWLPFCFIFLFIISYQLIAYIFFLLYIACHSLGEYKLW